ncbi:integrase core domain-containing protein [Streptomyces hirsutus]|uniref:integrase core domain-containing protein n=1 Tax=Streptomyces hirsutus TaxID=35620 RepID=UPI003330E789
MQQARNLAVGFGVRTESLRFLLRDRDGTYSRAFDAVFEAEDLDVIKTAPRPRRNARGECAIGSIQRKVLDHVLILKETHARRILAAYQAHHNEHRPHQAHPQQPPNAQEHPAAAHHLGSRRLLCTRILGGLVNEYRYAA